MRSARQTPLLPPGPSRCGPLCGPKRWESARAAVASRSDLAVLCRWGVERCGGADHGSTADRKRPLRQGRTRRHVAQHHFHSLMFAAPRAHARADCGSVPVAGLGHAGRLHQARAVGCCGVARHEQRSTSISYRYDFLSTPALPTSSLERAQQRRCTAEALHCRGAAEALARLIVLSSPLCPCRHANRHLTDQRLPSCQRLWMQRH